MGVKSIHFAISERKILLRLFDIVFSVLSLGLTSYFFSFDYFNYQNPDIIIWLITFTFYFILFGEVFQLYNLQISSNRFSVTKSLFLTTIVTTLFYFLTPYVSPSLPENRIQIVYFFLAISVPVLLWRFLYTTLLYTPKYFKNILLVSHSSKIENIVDLINNNGHYNISAYVSDKIIQTLSNLNYISETEVSDVVINKKITEIIISPIGFTKEEIISINKKMILLFEEGVTIKSYESFYEEITDRIPKEYLNFDFYNNINLIRNNDNKFYVLFHRLLDMIVSFIGIVILIILLPVIFLVNLIFNRGRYFMFKKG